MAADVRQFPEIVPKERVEMDDQIKIPGAFFETFTQEHGLTKLSRTNKIPTKVAYWAARLLVKITQEAGIYSKERQKLVDEFCDKDDQGKPVEAGPGQVKMVEHRAEFIAEMTKLTETEITIDIHKIPLKLAEIPDGVLSGVDIIGLFPFITFTDMIENEVPAQKD